MACDVASPKSKGRWNNFRKIVTQKVINATESLVDMSRLEGDQIVYKATLDVYSWVSICFYGWTFVKFMYTSFLHPNYPSPFLAFCIVCVVFGILAAVVTNTRKNILDTISWSVIVLCCCDPLLTDYSHVHRSPPLVAVPFSIYVSIRLMGVRFGCRPRVRLLGILLMPAFTMYTIYGVATSSLCIRYSSWAFVLLMVGAADLQLKFGHFYDSVVEQRCIVFEQVMSVVTLLTVNYCCALLFRGNTKI